VNGEDENQSLITVHRSPVARRDLIGAFSAGLIVVFFCLLLLWHDPLVFWNDDYALSILPVFADVARSWSERHLPLLSPYSWVCGNLAGEFQYGTFSIFVNAAIVFIWKFPLAFPQQAAALSITHLVVLAVGAFLLARNRELSIPLSIFVAVVTALSGWIICWGATDWFGALGAFAWLPWAWWGLERAQDRQRSCWRFLWPAPFVYLLVTGGFPYTVLMLVLLVAWLSIKTLGETRNTMSILPMLLGVTLGLGLSAPAWLAILDYVPGSARVLQPASAHWQWIVPPAALPGFVLPCWTVNWANFSTRYLPHPGMELACGLVAPAALIASFVGRHAIRDSRIASQERFRKIRWELLLLLLVLLLCMLPSAGVFRWSFRWLPFFHLVLALCAADVLGRSHAPDMSPLEKAVTHYRTPRILAAEALQLLPGLATPGTTALLLVGVTAIAMSILHTGGAYAFPLTWIFLAIAAGWAIGEFLSPNESLRAWLPAGVTFAALLATYLCVPSNCGVPKYNCDQKLLEATPLDSQRLYLSVYPPPELNYRIEVKRGPLGQVVRPGSTSMWAELRFINGYSPILPAGVAREWKFAIHGELDQWLGEYLLAEQARADGQLARVGVDGIVVAREFDFAPKPDAEWEFVAASNEGRVYHRRGAPFARVRSIRSIDSRPNESFVTSTISRIDDLRNHVEADVDVPNGSLSALLTFSRPYFRGYEARLGNQKLRVESYRGLFPVVELPSGSHGRLTLSYRPWWLVWGGVVAVASCIVLFVGLAAKLRNVVSSRA